MEQCAVGKCRQPTMIGYAAVPGYPTRTVSICWNHWQKSCDDEDSFDLKKYFKTKWDNERKAKRNSKTL